MQINTVFFSLLPVIMTLVQIYSQIFFKCDLPLACCVTTAPKINYRFAILAPILALIAVKPVNRRLWWKCERMPVILVTDLI